MFDKKQSFPPSLRRSFSRRSRAPALSPPDNFFFPISLRLREETARRGKNPFDKAQLIVDVIFAPRSRPHSSHSHFNVGGTTDALSFSRTELRISRNAIYISFRIRIKERPTARAMRFRSTFSVVHNLLRINDHFRDDQGDPVSYLAARPAQRSEGELYLGGAVSHVLEITTPLSRRDLLLFPSRDMISVAPYPTL